MLPETETLTGMEGTKSERFQRVRRDKTMKKESQEGEKKGERFALVWGQLPRLQAGRLSVLQHCA